MKKENLFQFQTPIVLPGIGAKDIVRVSHTIVEPPASDPRIDPENSIPVTRITLNILFTDEGTEKLKALQKKAKEEFVKTQNQQPPSQIIQP